MLTLNENNHEETQSKLATRARRERLRQEWTQEALASRAGVSLGSLKRFERTGQISLHSLLKIAMALDALAAFDLLFAAPEFASLDEVLAENASEEKPARQRGSRK